MPLKPFLLFEYFERVQFGTQEHLLPIALWLICIIVLIFYAKTKFNTSRQWLLINTIAILVSLTVISYHVYNLLFEDYRLDKDLPLYLCSLLAIIIPLFTYYKKYWMFEILIFWIIAGTLQGVITPDIKATFPSFEYFRYWVVHLGLLTVILYIVFVFNWKPKFKSVFKSFLTLQIYVVMMMVINFFLSSNYFYLNEKPQSATLLDYMGDWPWYIIIGQLVLIPYFMLIYLPFYILERKSN